MKITDIVREAAADKKRTITLWPPKAADSSYSTILVGIKPPGPVDAGYQGFTKQVHDILITTGKKFGGDLWDKFGAPYKKYGGLRITHISFTKGKEKKVYAELKRSLSSVATVVEAK